MAKPAKLIPEVSEDTIPGFNNPEPVKFERTRKKQVTKEVIRQANGQTKFVQFESTIRTSEVHNDGRGKDMKPADIIDVIDLETGELGIMIVNTVLRSNIERHYPDESYVGKCFEIYRSANTTKGAEGKTYATYKIWEIE